MSSVLPPTTATAAIRSGPSHDSSVADTFERRRRAWEFSYSSAFPGRWCGVEPMCALAPADSFRSEDRNSWAERWVRWIAKKNALRGIEIGACAMPVKFPAHASVTYVDRDISSQKAACGYAKDRRRVAVQDDAQVLSSFQPRTQDFVMANHVLEHMDDFVLAIESWLRATKPRGFVFASVPDMCDPLWQTGERFRMATKPGHFFDEYRRNTSSHDDEGAIMLLGMQQAALDWPGLTPARLAGAEAELKQKPYLTHRHTFTYSTLGKTLTRAARLLRFRVVDLYTARRGAFNMQEHRMVLQPL